MRQRPRMSAAHCRRVSNMSVQLPLWRVLVHGRFPRLSALSHAAANTRRVRGTIGPLSELPGRIRDSRHGHREVTAPICAVPAPVAGQATDADLDRARQRFTQVTAENVGLQVDLARQVVAGNDTRPVCGRWSCFSRLVKRSIIPSAATVGCWLPPRWGRRSWCCWRFHSRRRRWAICSSF